jgi:hypothetical protein
MRKTIPPDVATRPAFVVEADEASIHVTLEADGQPHRFGPDEARQIGRALLQAASVVDPRDGADDQLDGDLPDLD